MLLKLLATCEHPLRVTRQPHVQNTTWRDHILTITGDTSVLDDDDPSLDDPLQIADDIPALVDYVGSSLRATAWCLQAGVCSHVLYQRRRSSNDDDRVTESPRETLERLRIWLIQHSNAYAYDHPQVANDMIRLANALWNIVESDTGEHMYDAIMDILAV